MGEQDEDILCLDLTSSQEDNLTPVNARKRKESIQSGSSSKRARDGSEITPKGSGSSIYGKADFESLMQRVNALEGAFMKKEEVPHVSREEFDDCLRRIAKVEERVTKVEQIIRDLKSVFVGTRHHSKDRHRHNHSTRKQSDGTQAEAAEASTSSMERRGADVTITEVNLRPSPTTNANPPTLSKQTASTSSAVTSAETMTLAIGSDQENRRSAPSLTQSTEANESATSHAAAADKLRSQELPSTSSTPSSSFYTHRARSDGNQGSNPQKRRSVDQENLVPSRPGLNTSGRDLNQRAGPSSSSHNDHSNNQHRTSSSLERDQPLGSYSRKSPATEFREQLANTPQKGRYTSSMTLQSAGPSSTPIRRNQAYSNPNARQIVTPSTSGREQYVSRPSITSSVLKDNLTTILSAAPPSEWSGPSAINFGDLPDDLLSRMTIKQEMYEQPLNRLNTSQFRKDPDDRFLIYIDGNCRKMRNHNVYAAAAGASIGDNWLRIQSYISDLTPNMDQDNPNKQNRKLGEAIKRQSVVIAAWLAIEDLKKHSEPGLKKIKIVAQSYKLASIMSGIKFVYPFNLCKCPQFPCTHKDRWCTVDSLAASLPDDLPRLVMASQDHDIIWHAEKHEENLSEQFQKGFKKEISELLQQNQPRKK